MFFRPPIALSPLIPSPLPRTLSQVQAVVLAYPMGVNRLVEMLADRREVIRNEMLLMLEALTLGNENIKKIVAFEGYVWVRRLGGAIAFSWRKDGIGRRGEMRALRCISQSQCESYRSFFRFRMLVL